MTSAQSGNTLPSEDEITKMNHQMLKQKLLEIGEMARHNESEAVFKLRLSAHCKSMRSRTSNTIDEQSCVPTKLNLGVSLIENQVEMQDKNRQSNIEMASLICTDVNDQLALKKQLSIRTDLDIRHMDHDVIKLAMEQSGRFRYIFNGFRDNFQSWQRQLLARKATYQIFDGNKVYVIEQQSDQENSEYFQCLLLAK
ncbi:hypothetical protein RFI_38264 [Reticulomyxa filosa]|uniref:Uncharacterized protein n=1 Tax=Reticulomyxa filosa TaxID=46433 RepID=X6LB11_RETFI|nr:hypothetical protein RFI_38264 [Reticulomyxa filosa]|eukprot:ETN99217.1 hypothetical protein RFI_38264 [Reticulomyxa filosa]